jgi:hypothetical protein
MPHLNVVVSSYRYGMRRSDELLRPKPVDLARERLRSGPLELLLRGIVSKRKAQIAVFITKPPQGTVEVLIQKAQL